MKRLISIILVVVICCALCACGKSENAKACEELIAKIGTLTLDSEDAIISAEKAYAALSEDEKSKITDSAQKLEGYRKEYNEKFKPIKDFMAAVDAIGEVSPDSLDKITAAQALSDKLSAEQANQLGDYSTKFSKIKIDFATLAIEDIGEVTIDSEEKISRAKSAYELLTDDEKAQISELCDKFLSASENFNALKVIASIDAIGEVTLESGKAIKDATAMYNNLSESEKALVTNYNILEQATAEYGVIWEDEAQELLTSFRVKEDSNGITWYSHDRQPQYINERTYVLPYIAVKPDGQVRLILRYIYHGRDWVNWKTASVVVDDTSYTFTPTYSDIVHDESDGYVWEYRDDSNPDIEMLKKIAESKETVVTFQGDSTSHKHIISIADKNAIKDIIALYELLKSK